jgi:hypothetical protein
MGRLGHRPYIVNFLRCLGKLPTHRRSPTRARRHPAKLFSLLLVRVSRLEFKRTRWRVLFPIRHLEIEIAGEIGVAALWGTGDLTPKPLGFETITVRVRIEADVSREILEALVEHTAMWSPRCQYTSQSGSPGPRR